MDWSISLSKLTEEEIQELESLAETKRNFFGGTEGVEDVFGTYRGAIDFWWDCELYKREELSTMQEVKEKLGGVL